MYLPVPFELLTSALSTYLLSAFMVTESLISNNGTSIFGSVIVDDSIKNLLQSYIKNGEVYLNLHTSMYPNGEVRGQIKYDQNLRFDARIDTTQVTGNLNTISSAIG